MVGAPAVVTDWPKRRLALAVSMLAMGMLPVAVTGANMAFPAITRHFEGASLSTLSWALSGYSIVIAALTLIGGQLTDRLGSFPVFLTGVVIYTLMSLLAAAAPTAMLFVLARAIQGVGGALIVPASLGVVLSRWPAERHRFAIGVWTASFPLGSSIAPVATALLLEWRGWRTVFLGAAILGTVTVALTLWLGAAPTATQRLRGGAGLPDLLGVAVGTASVALAALGISQAPVWGWSSLKTMTCLTVAVALVPVMVWRSKTHPRPLISPDLFRVRSFRIANIANIPVSAMGMASWLVWPLFLVNVWKYRQLGVGLAISPTPIIGGLGSLLVAKWAERRGYRLPLIVGSVSLISACVVFAMFPTVVPNYWASMFVGLLIFGAAMGLLFAPLNAAALSEIPAASVGQANATFSTGRFLSGGLGIAATVAVLGSTGGQLGTGPNPLAPFDRAYTFLGALGVASLLIVTLGWPREQRSAP
jgi:NTE family protein